MGISYSKLQWQLYLYPQAAACSMCQSYTAISLDTWLPNLLIAVAAISVELHVMNVSASELHL